MSGILYSPSSHSAHFLRVISFSDFLKLYIDPNSHKFIFLSQPCGNPRYLSGKESTCQCRRCQKRQFNPWVRKILWRRAWPLTPVFLPGESHGQRSQAGYSPQGRRVRHDWATSLNFNFLSLTKVPSQSISLPLWCSVKSMEFKKQALPTRSSSPSWRCLESDSLWH